MSNLEANLSRPDPTSPSRSFSDNDLLTNRAPSDPNHVSQELSDHLKNVGLADKPSKFPISVSVGETDSKDRKEEEERRNGFEREKSNKMFMYPLRPEAEDCSFFMRTGSCKYGSSCKFNHPLHRKLQIGKEKVKEREEEVMENPNPRLMDCKYYFRTGGCKYGASCKFNHDKQQTSLNFLGLPIRPGEKECPFYMRNGSCKFGSDCRFNHPDPTALGGLDSPVFSGNNGGSFSPNAASIASPTSWSSPRHLNGTAPFIPVMFSPKREVVKPSSPSVYTSERSLLSPSTYQANGSSSSFSRFQQRRMTDEEFPERPDQPECSYYMRTGDCNFKYSCKFHHPKNRLPKQAPSSFNDKGLPLRPGESMCMHYSRYGICKFGPACTFDHSVPPALDSPDVSDEENENERWN